MINNLVKEHNKLAKKKEVKEVPFEGAKTISDLAEIRDFIKQLQEQESQLKTAINKHLTESGDKAQEYQDEAGNRWQAEIREQDRRSIDEPSLIGYLQESKPSVWDAVKKVTYTIDETLFKGVMESGQVTVNEIPMKGSIVKSVYVKKVG